MGIENKCDWAKTGGRVDFDGQCCCNCRHQVTLTKHPWNKSESVNGSGFFSYGCAMPFVFGEREVAIHDHGGHRGKHGMCEMWESVPALEVK